MSNDICLNCFKVKGNFEVCPHCGWVEGTLPGQAFHLRSGVTLSDRYIIGTVTGFGGFGTIYKAWDSQLSTIVAIKEFYPAGLVSRVPGTAEVVVFSGEKRDNYLQAKDRFLSEAKSLAMFNKNPSIVNVYSFFEENNTAYIVMEYLDGLSLREYLAQEGGKLSVELSLEIVRPVMDALIAIHDKGIVHRDIHPGNIFITNNKRIKLLDFGAARLSTGEDEATLTVVVTQGYASPEQYRTKSKQGPFTDIYGLGATLYKMITGVLPEEALDRQVKDNLKKPSELGVKVEENLNRATMKAMALKPEIRFQKVSEFRDAVFKNSKIDYPEVEYKKRRTRRGIVIAGVMAALAVLVVTVSLYSTVLRPTQTLESIIISEDTIKVWIPISEDAEVLAAQETAWQRVIEGFERDNQQIDVEPEMIPESEYSKRIGETEGSDKPTLYNIDEVRDYQMSSFVSLDLLYDSLDPKEYNFLENYDKLFPSKKAMPLSFKVYTLYGNDQVAKNEGKTIPDVITDINALFDGKNSVCINEKDMPGFLLLYGAEADGNGGFRAGAGLADSIIALKQSYRKQNADPTKPPLDVLKNDELLYLFSNTSDLRSIQNALPGYYDVIDLENDGNLAGDFSDLWAVSGAATENQQNAAMKFIAYLLNDLSQDEFFLQQDKAMPMNKTIFEQFVQLNPDFEYLSGKTENILFAGENMPGLRLFGDAVFSEILKQNITDEQIRTFLEGYGGDGAGASASAGDDQLE